MSGAMPLTSLAYTFPLHLEYLTWPRALGLFALLAVPIVWLGVRSLNGLGPVRKWVAIGVRLAVLALFVLIVGGVRWQRTNEVLEVMVLRDISESTAQVRDYPGKTLQGSIDEWLQKVADDKNGKPREDRVGVASFHSSALIDAMPSPRLVLDARAIRDTGSGTDVASALQLALATLSKDAMHRLLLIWDGNQTLGDLESAVAQAAAQNVQVYVMPLAYDVQNEVLLERFVAPTWKRENEPFSVDVILRSTNALPTTGKLSVFHQNIAMPIGPNGEAFRTVTLQPGLNVERVRVPALEGSNVIHQFRATFEADGGGANVTADVAQGQQPGQPAGPEGAAGAGAGAAAGDTLLANNTADAFTFVRGKGRILYVDNVADGRGDVLAAALAKEGINLQKVTVDQVPNTLVELQNYDAIVLANVPRGAGGLSEEQQKMVASYVHDMGGGLVMIGGPDAFGAGGWQGSRLEEILPVNMDIPAQRQIPKGALVLIMHSCEMPDGNYWGEQCAIKASETLSERDEIGVLSFNWQGGGSQWDFPLQPKGDGTRVVAAIKQMQLGDMPSFDDSMNVALNGINGVGGLIRSDARQKHVIIISDGDPAAPNANLVAQYQKAQVSVSTVTVYPHMGDADGLPPTMKEIARILKGRAYGPINANPNQLPQIFIKEATVVRRTLIHEDAKGIPLQTPPSASEIMKGLQGAALPPVFGMVLTSKKPNPQIEMPIFAGKNADPILAHWQTGLGRAAVWTPDAHNKWSAGWVGSDLYNKFWAQVVRAVARPPMSADFDVQVTQDGTKGRITVEALNKDSAFMNFMNISGVAVGPDPDKKENVRLVQTGPGTYAAEFDARDPGNYVVVLQYRGAKGEQGALLGGMAVNASPELRDLQSNEAALRMVAERTGGKVIEPFAPPAAADLFSREGLKVTASPLPIWDLLIPVLLGLILVDVATRRIAWDWNSTKKMALSAVGAVRSYTTTRKVETRQSLDALKRVRDEVAETKFKVDQDDSAAPAAPRTPPVDRPDPRAKFEVKQGVEGDISQVVGGATAKPIPPPPKKVEPKGAQGDAPGHGHTGSLLEAKRRARQQIEQKEKGE
jgi:uncharacterized membrane protein